MDERSAAFNSDETRADWLAGAKALAPAMALNKTAIFILTGMCGMYQTVVRRQGGEEGPTAVVAERESTWYFSRDDDDGG